MKPIFLNFGDNVHFRPLFISSNAAIEVSAFQGCIVRKKERGNRIDYGVQFDVVMVPVFPFRTVTVIDVTEDQYTVPVTYRKRYELKL